MLDRRHLIGTLGKRELEKYLILIYNYYLENNVSIDTKVSRNELVKYHDSGFKDSEGNCVFEILSGKGMYYLGEEDPFPSPKCIEFDAESGSLNITEEYRKIIVEDYNSVFTEELQEIETWVKNEKRNQLTFYGVIYIVLCCVCIVLFTIATIFLLKLVITFLFLACLSFGASIFISIK